METLDGQQLKNLIEESPQFKVEKELLNHGFFQDECGQYKYIEENGLKIIIYHVDQWEVDIILPNGTTIGLDTSDLAIGKI